MLKVVLKGFTQFKNLPYFRTLNPSHSLSTHYILHLPIFIFTLVPDIIKY